MTHVRVKPAREGESLVHPLDGPLAAEGGLWRRDQFTFKRLRDEDVIEVDDDGQPVKPATAEADEAEKPVPEPEAKALPAPPAKARGVSTSTTGPSAADAPKE